MGALQLRCPDAEVRAALSRPRHARGHRARCRHVQAEHRAASRRPAGLVPGFVPAARRRPRDARGRPADVRRAVRVVPHGPGRDALLAGPSTGAGGMSPVPFSQALRFWLKLGFISFGGPAGQIAIMHRELVEQRRWISERRFLHALNYCMLLPGPEAQQLATYIGWLMHRTWGGIVAGGLFVLPSLAILIFLSWVYAAFGNVAVIAGLFYGIKPAVAAIVLQAVWRIGGRTLRHPRDVPALWA